MLKDALLKCRVSTLTVLVGVLLWVSCPSILPRALVAVGLTTLRRAAFLTLLKSVMLKRLRQVGPVWMRTFLRIQVTVLCDDLSTVL